MHQLTRLIPQSLQTRLEEARSFLLVGVGNLIFTYTVYLLVNLFAPYTVAFTVSFSVGILFSAFWNARLSFSTRLTAKRLALFTIVCVVNYFIGLQILKFFVENLGVAEFLAPLLVIAAMVPISFVGTRLALVGSLTKDGRSDMRENSEKGSSKIL